MKVINHLINSIRASAKHNPEAETRPQCILWTDKERQWENVIIKMLQELPELLILGEYKTVERKGPAIWIRAAIGGCVDGYSLSYGQVPVIYLPGVSRQDLRAIEQCPEELKPLAELQYRGVIWSQINARDWTIYAYLKTKKFGLGLDVSQDDATLQAMQRALNRILDEKIENLKSNYLDKDFFNALISGSDTVKDILLWMSEPDNFKAARTNEEWQAFIEICKSKYKFNPEQDGILGASEKIGWHDESWDIVWNRFCEAPTKYKAIPDILRKTIMPIIENQDRFPQWNDQQEKVLREELLKLSGMVEQSARDKILRLEKDHTRRRNSVWAELGEAPLARALRWIAEIAAKTVEVIAGNFSDMISAQNTWGWNVDYAAILALSSVASQEDIEAVFTAIRSVYLPWIDRNSINLQKVVNDNGYPLHYKNHQYNHDECVCFIDGLRFDLAKKLSENFKISGMSVKEEIVWTPLPTVTATCKPSLTPITDMITGDDFNNQDFSPIIKTSGQSATSEKINNIMEDQGWIILEDSKLGKLNHNGWYDFGRIDEEGHKLGWRIAPQVDNYINEVQERVGALFKAGWKTVKIVSDHGWLLMPGGLPKMQMPISLTESKWGRCAAIKPGALFDGTCYPWYWNENVHFALADGVCCYRNGIEYTHGGVSLQECLMLQLELSENDESQEIKEFLVTDIIWKKMRCRIAAEGNLSGIKADIRIKPAMADTSIVMGIKEFNETGLVSVVVDDDAHEGKTAYVILLDSNNKVIYQTTTVVGGGD